MMVRVLLSETDSDNDKKQPNPKIRQGVFFFPLKMKGRTKPDKQDNQALII